MQAWHNSRVSAAFILVWKEHLNAVITDHKCLCPTLMLACCATTYFQNVPCNVCVLFHCSCFPHFHFYCLAHFTSGSSFSSTWKSPPPGSILITDACGSQPQSREKPRTIPGSYAVLAQDLTPSGHSQRTPVERLANVYFLRGFSLLSVVFS